MLGPHGGRGGQKRPKNGPHGLCMTPKKEFNGFENYSLLDNAHLTRGRPNRLASASCSPDCVFMQCKATLLCYFQKISSILSCHQAVHRLQITQLQISPPPITAPLSLLLLLVQQGGSKIFFFIFPSAARWSAAAAVMHFQSSTQ